MCLNTSQSLQAETILLPSVIMVCFLAASAMSVQQTEKVLLWCYRLMHWRLEGCVRCRCAFNFQRNHLRQTASFVLYCQVYFTVPRKIDAHRGAFERAVMFQTDCPNGVDVSGDSRHKWSHTTNPQALLLYISAPLSSRPPQHPLGYFWPLMKLDDGWRGALSSHLCHLCSAEPPARRRSVA